MNRAKVDGGFANVLPTARVYGVTSLLTLLIALAFLATPARAQQNLSDIVSDFGFEWIIGEWTATTDEGQTVKLTYAWGLDKHLVTVGLRMGNYVYQGMIFFKSVEEEVVQIGVDNQGGHSKGLWEPVGDKALARSEFINAEGRVTKMGIMHSKGDAGTMKAELFGVQDDGELAETPWATMEYKRKKGLVGKWRGEFENEWGEKGSFAALITETGGGDYQIKLMDSFDEWAETIVVLKARKDSSGKVMFEGKSDMWTGTGSGTMTEDIFKGTFKGDESGKFTMRRIAKP